MASEIMTLPDLSGYLKLPGNTPVYRVNLQIKDRKMSAPIYVQRDRPLQVVGNRAPTTPVLVKD